MSQAPCFACQTAERFPLTELKGDGTCLRCQARELAKAYAGKQRDQTEPEMRKLWPNQSDYIAGRLSFHLWARAIEEAKAKEQT